MSSGQYKPLLREHMPNKCTIKTKPQERPKSLTIHEMYMTSTKQDTNFGIQGYEAAKVYQDPAKQKRDREFAEYRKKNKFPKNTVKPTKRGNYLDDIQKNVGKNPGVGKYKIEYEWVNKKDIEKGKSLPKNTTKNSYIDKIINEQKNQKFPGVGKYNIIKTQKEIEEDIKKLKQKQVGKGASRLTSTEATQFVAAQIPGPGNYNPHDPRKENLHPERGINQTKPSDWIKKHTEQSKTQRQRSKTGTAVGSYNPQPTMFMTFDKLAQKGKIKTAVKHMGLEERFKDPKKTKSLVSKPVPGPNVYNMQAKWIGKEDGQKGNKKDTTNWMNRISRGISKSIYY